MSKEWTLKWRTITEVPFGEEVFLFQPYYEYTGHVCEGLINIPPVPPVNAEPGDTEDAKAIKGSLDTPPPNSADES